jgi:hypothetical protein
VTVIDSRDGRRSELAAFLRTRRARISPQDVGLPPGIRRRTPGLRREEVAQLAGIGVTWYTWLEQGRRIHASLQVLDAIGRTLRLDQAELEHLYRLADVSTAPVEATLVTVPPRLQEILDALDPLPASLLNARFDLLAFNQAHEDLLWEWHSMTGQERNMLWCCFVRPDARTRFPNFDDDASYMVAVLRGAYGQHLNEPAWVSFLERLSAASPDFDKLWARHEVASPESRIKHYIHPDVGLLRLRSTNLFVADLPETRINVSTPVDEETRQRLLLTRRNRDRRDRRSVAHADGHTPR